MTRKYIESFLESVITFLLIVTVTVVILLGVVFLKTVTNTPSADDPPERSILEPEPPR